MSMSVLQDSTKLHRIHPKIYIVWKGFRVLQLLTAPKGQYRKVACFARCRAQPCFSRYTKIHVYFTLHDAIGQNIGKEADHFLVECDSIHEAEAKLPTGLLERNALM